MIATRDLIIIVCNGRETEKQYLDYFKNQVERSKIAHITLEIVPQKDKSEPLRIVNKAVELKRHAGSQLNDTYAIIDIDQFDGIEEAVMIAEQNGVKLIFSNPSFEYWLLCHFEQTSATMTNTQLLSRLNKYIPNYDKTHLPMKVLIKCIRNAINNAKVIHQTNLRDNRSMKDANSSSNMYQLVDRLMRWMTCKIR